MKFRFFFNPLSINKYIFSKFVEKKLEEPFNQCQKTEETSYRSGNCQQKCMMETVGRKCNCTFPGYYALQGKTFCSDGNGGAYDQTLEIECFRKFSEIELRSECKKKCPVSCETTTITSERYTRDHPELTIIEVYFSSLTFLQVSQVPKIYTIGAMTNIGNVIGI